MIGIRFFVIVILHLGLNHGFFNRLQYFRLGSRSTLNGIPKYISNPSEEQTAVLIDVHDKNVNVVVDSVAGSGKTTLALQIASYNASKLCLLLTYNSLLKTETREKVEKLRIGNLEVHSFHAMGCKYYSAECYRDKGIRSILDSKKSPTLRLFPYDIVIIDEVQDMQSLYFDFVNKLLCDIPCSPVVILVGDEMQCIYGYLGADSRYLKLADSGFYKTVKPWKREKLSTSYRLTTNIAAFINKGMLGWDKIKATKIGGPVLYLRGNSFQSARWLGHQLVSMIRSGSLKAEDVFILSSSRKSNGKRPIVQLENFLVESKIPVFSASSEAENLSDSASGKVTFCTMHQSKGRERRCVIIFDFNSNFFNFFAKDEDPYTCPNVLYVAASRSTEMLWLVGEEIKGSNVSTPLPFLQREALFALASGDKPALVFPDIHKRSPDGNELLPIVPLDPKFLLDDADGYTPRCSESIKVSATDLTKFISETAMGKAKALLQPVLVCKAYTKISLPVTTDGEYDLKEDVADLNGLAIPAMFEVETTGCCTMYNELKDANISVASRYQLHKQIGLRFDKLPPPDEMNNNPEHYLSLAALYQTSPNGQIWGYISGALQIKSFNWLNQSTANACLDVLRQELESQHIPKKKRISAKDRRERIKMFKFEYPVQGFRPWQSKNVTIQGRMDVVTPEAVVEVKCVAALEDRHFLQLAIYAWLWQQTQQHLGSRKFRLINLCTGETWEIVTDELDEVMDILLDQKYIRQPKVDDAAFLGSANRFQS